MDRACGREAETRRNFRDVRSIGDSEKGELGNEARSRGDGNFLVEHDWCLQCEVFSLTHTFGLSVVLFE